MFSGAHFDPASFDLDLDLMDLAVELGWHKAEPVLAVELVGDAGKGGAEVVLLVLELEIATAAGLRQVLQCRVGRLGGLRQDRPARPDRSAPADRDAEGQARPRVLVATDLRPDRREADAVDHHVGRPRPLQQPFEFCVLLIEQRRVVSIGEPDDDAASRLRDERGNAAVDCRPHRRRPGADEVVTEHFEQDPVIARELRRADANLVAEAANARAIGRQHLADEGVDGIDWQVVVIRHAAAAIQQDDGGERLHVVGEKRERHRLPVVSDDEIFLAQVGHEPLIFVHDGGVDRNDIRPGVKLGTFLLRRQRGDSERRHENRADHRGSRSSPSAEAM